MTLEAAMNRMSLMAGALSSSSIDGGANTTINDNNSNTGVGGGVGDGRRHINFDLDAANNDNNEKDGTNDPDQVRELATTTSTGSDYYAKGSAEVATESALTLAKIQHVSC